MATNEINRPLVPDSIDMFRRIIVELLRARSREIPPGSDSTIETRILTDPALDPTVMRDVMELLVLGGATPDQITRSTVTGSRGRLRG